VGVGLLSVSLARNWCVALLVSQRAGEKRVRFRVWGTWGWVDWDGLRCGGN
jgi:hypothetical protein